jgi:hypothetical protein
MLHKMLMDMEESGNDHILSWLPGGRSFRIHDRAEFTAKILPKYYSNRLQIRSFMRQLNLYGFERNIQKISDEFGAYTHPFFVRASPELCCLIVRKDKRHKVKKIMSSLLLLNSKWDENEQEAPDYDLVVGGGEDHFETEDGRTKIMTNNNNNVVLAPPFAQQQQQQHIITQASNYLHHELESFPGEYYPATSTGGEGGDDALFIMIGFLFHSLPTTTTPACPVQQGLDEEEDCWEPIADWRNGNDDIL